MTNIDQLSKLAKKRGKLIAELRGAMSQRKFAEMIGIEQATLSRIENGEMDLFSPHLFKIAKGLKIAPQTLLGEKSTVVLAEIGDKRLPLLAASQVLVWPEISPVQIGEEMQKHVLTDVDYSDTAFALTIRGSSMEPDFREGDIVIADPAAKLEPGDLVVAVAGEEEVVFRKYRPRGLNDQGKEYFVLEPLNTDFEPLRSDLQTVRIVGPMVEHRKYRKR